MTFNKDSRINPGRVQRRGRSASTGSGGMAVGGGLGGILLLLLGLFLGVDLTGLVDTSGGSTVQPADPAIQQNFDASCQTGEDANNDDNCRAAFTIASLDDYWESAAPAMGARFDYPGVVLFDHSTTSACG